MRTIRAEIAEIEERLASGEVVAHGSKRAGLKVLRPLRTKSVVTNVAGERIVPPKAAHATDRIDVAIFMGAVFRSGWSGCHTYPGPPIQNEFFAAPPVLRAAVLGGGSLYLLSKDYVQPHPELPAEYVAYQEVPVAKGDEYPVHITDMRSLILNTPFLPRAHGDRDVITGEPSLDINSLLELPETPPWITWGSPYPHDSWYEFFKWGETSIA